MQMPPLVTDRLIIRAFRQDDLAAIHRILDMALGDTLPGDSVTAALEAREAWLTWTVASYAELANLHQPPFGDRAIELQDTGQVIGACGYAPVLAPLAKLPSFRHMVGASPELYLSEVGLYWALGPTFQGQGYAAEAARALIDYAFAELRLARILATTTHNNLPSQRVMERLGMRIEHNPDPAPEWFQVVGILENTEMA
jgi:RimJ/RimL family protein N-acetyltransferase